MSTVVYKVRSWERDNPFRLGPMLSTDNVFDAHLVELDTCGIPLCQDNTVQIVICRQGTPVRRARDGSI